MHGTTTGEDIFLEVQKALKSYKLRWNQLQCVTVDGGKSLVGLKKGLVEWIMIKLKKIQLPKALFLHCITHQQALCGKHLDIFCILKPVVFVVNFIRDHALNHRQFQNFFKTLVLNIVNYFII